MSKHKRMVYIYEENLEFYDSLTDKSPFGNKSKFINDALQDARINTRIKETPGTPKEDENINYVRQKLADIDAKNRGE